MTTIEENDVIKTEQDNRTIWSVDVGNLPQPVVEEMLRSIVEERKKILATQHLHDDAQ